MYAVFVHQRQLWNELPSTLKDNNITVEHSVSLRMPAPQTLIRTLVMTKLDHCNSVLVGIYVYLQD